MKDRRQGGQRRGQKRVVRPPEPSRSPKPVVRDSAASTDWRVVDIVVGVDGKVNAVEIECGTSEAAVRRRLVNPRGVLDEVAKQDPTARLMGAMAAEVISSLLLPPNRRRDRFVGAAADVVFDKAVGHLDPEHRKPSLWDRALQEAAKAKTAGPQKMDPAMGSLLRPTPAGNAPPDDPDDPEK